MCHHKRITRGGVAETLWWQRRSHVPPQAHHSWWRCRDLVVAEEITCATTSASVVAALLRPSYGLMLSPQWSFVLETLW